VTPFWLRFILAVFATWRVTHLLASEDGPGDLIVRVRARLGNSFLGRLMDCFYCLSLWLAVPLAFYVAVEALDRVIVWLALSGAACLLERATNQPTALSVFEQTEGGMKHALLRPKPAFGDEPGDSGAHLEARSPDS
jgi:hypothetical protein